MAVVFGARAYGSRRSWASSLILLPNGLLILTTRSDFARERHPTGGPVQVSPTPDGPVITFQLWDWDPDGRHYDMPHSSSNPTTTSTPSACGGRGHGRTREPS